MVVKKMLAPEEMQKLKEKSAKAAIEMVVQTLDVKQDTAMTRIYTAFQSKIIRPNNTALSIRIK